MEKKGSIIKKKVKSNALWVMVLPLGYIILSHTLPKSYREHILLSYSGERRTKNKEKCKNRILI